MTNFEKITASPEALGEFLASLPVATGPWDEEFHRAFCDSCERENCDEGRCPHQDKRNNPLWWLMLGGKEGEVPGLTVRIKAAIPDVDGPWWLATPWRTPGEKFGGAAYALHVFASGNWSYYLCPYAGYAIRPALLFSSSLLVSIEDEEAADEASLYSGYVDYVREWMDEDPDVGSSPMSYEEWKKDGGQEEA